MSAGSPTVLSTVMEEEVGQSTSFNLDFVQAVLRSVVVASKTGNSLPSIGNNYELLSSFPVFAKLMDVEGKRLLDLMSQILRHAGVKTSISSTTEDKDEILDKLIDANDALVERIGIALDEAEGIRKPPEPLVISSTRKSNFISTSWNKTIGDTLTPYKTTGDEKQINLATVKLIAARNVVRPQTKFMDTIDNSNRPFVPKLKVKDNAKAVWKGNVTIFVDNEEMETNMQTDQQQTTHPYQYELDHYEIISDLLQKRSPQLPRLLAETPCIVVATECELKKLCQDLKAHKEFAVDLEHHSYRTFLGLTCLMQISTRETDYLIDTLELWRHMHLLNDPFTDPSILKVFHGADMDIIWLQRDFGIYAVNMFDTGQAARALHLPRFGLGYLIKHYLNKDLEKQYQFADWRIRPMPQELVHYAREDTHYLLYVCDLMTNSLLEMGNDQQNLLKAVYHRSRDICLQQYHKPTLKENDHLFLYEKHKKVFNNRQLAALEQLYLWRDKLARVEDESLAYILPDHMLLQIAEVLPREMQGILACCNPTPPMVKQELHYLHRLVMKAKELPLERKTTEEGQAATFSHRQRNPLLHIQHDYSHIGDDEEMPMQMDTSIVAPTKLNFKSEPNLRLFANCVLSPDAIKTNGVPWISPYQKYLVAKELEASMEKKSKELAKVQSEIEAPQPVLRLTVTSVPSSSTEETVMETSEPANKSTKGTLRKGKRRQERNATEEGSQSTSVESKVKRSKVEIDQVVPFDYGAVESTLEAKGSKKPKHFDPARDAAKSGAKGKKGGGRKKFGGRSDKKSVTYGARKHQQNLSHRSFPKN